LRGGTHFLNYILKESFTSPLGGNKGILHYLKLGGMAKQIGPNYLVGIHGGLCWYKMDGQYYVRTLSAIHYSKKAKRFRNTMASAERLANASKIASIIYRALPKHWKQYWMFRAFTGEAALLMKYEKTMEQTLEFLWKRYAAEFAEGYNEAENFVHKSIAERTENTKAVTIKNGASLSRYSRVLEHGRTRIGRIVTDRDRRAKYIKVEEKCHAHERAGPALMATP
jgi:hypothetical protein